MVVWKIVWLGLIINRFFCEEDLLVIGGVYKLVEIVLF